MSDTTAWRRLQPRDLGIVVNQPVTESSLKNLETAIALRDDLVSKQITTIAELTSQTAKLSSEKQALQNQATALQTQLTELQGRVTRLSIQRPKLSPENLMSSFKKALDGMQESLRTVEGGPRYQIATFDVSLKTNATIDDGGRIQFQLPKLDDVLPPDNLSQVKFSVINVPTMEAPSSKTTEIPNVVGQSKDNAVAMIKEAKLKVGDVTDRQSITSTGTVIEQKPEAYALVSTDTKINLVVASPVLVTVPDLTKKTADEAMRMLDESKLKLGERKEKSSTAPPGTVIDQKPKAGSQIPIGTPVDITTAKTTG